MDLEGPGWRILLGDCREELKRLDDNSVHLCVTSPPYFGLRRYITGRWEGGSDDCDHAAPSAHQKPGKTSILRGRDNGHQRNDYFSKACRKCGAVNVDRQMGLEPTPDEFAAALVEVFREVRRVLHPSGVVFLNLGDSYNAAGRTGHGSRIGYKQGTNRASANGEDSARANAPGLKPKDLIGAPWLVAFALRADGWYLRSEIIWSKANGMTESVKDRPTKSHETIFLLTKREQYFYDYIAVSEPASYPVEQERLPSGEYSEGSGRRDGSVHRSGGFPTGATRNLRSVWSLTSEPSHLSLRTSHRVRVFGDDRNGGDIYCTRSADCPIHGSSDPKDPIRGDDEPGFDPSSRIAGTGFYPSPMPSDEPSSTPDIADPSPNGQTMDYSPQSGVPSAIDHNTSSRRKDPAHSTNSPYTSYAGTLFDTDDTPESQECVDRHDCIPESKTSECDPCDDTSVQTSSCNDGTSPSRPPQGCTCSYYRIVVEDTSHFATMPTRLVETCVKAGTSERGACPGCGEPWRRIIEKGEADRALQRACGGDREGQYDGQARKEYEAAGVQNPSELKARILSGMVEKITVGWEPGCSCGMEPAPCLVLDPFTGTGTTGEVALAMGRKFVGVELSPKYAEMAAGRLTVMPTYTGMKKPAKTNPGQMSWLEDAAP